MSPLQFLLIVSGFIFLLFAIDSFQRRKFNFLHFLVFFGGGFVITVFSFNLSLLDKFGAFFGIARGADLLVYIAIIFLGYFYFEILNRLTRHSQTTTKLVTNHAINELIKTDFYKNKIKSISNKDFKDEFVVLMRCFNESSVIGNVIDSVVNYGFDKIVLVNDGSSDNSLDVIEEKLSMYNDKLIFCMSHEINRGGGSANKTGFEFLKRFGDSLKIKYVITFDADDQMNISDIEKFIENGELKGENGNYDILLGSRFVKGGSASNMPLPRKIILFGSKLVTLFFNKIWVSDPHNGYRVITLSALKKINITSDGMTYASEILDETKRLNLKFKEIPVNIKYSEYSLSKGQKNSNAIKILFELIYKKFFYR